MGEREGMEKKARRSRKRDENQWRIQHPIPYETSNLLTSEPYPPMLTCNPRHHTVSVSLYPYKMEVP